MGGETVRFDWKNPSRGLAITVIVLISIGLGFFADFIVTCLEKSAYPQGYSEYVTVYAEAYGVPERNAGLDEAKAGIKIARRNINNLRYADDS